MRTTKTLIATLALLTTALALAAVPATAQDPAFDSGNLASGDRFSWTPEAPGTYSYHCTYHPGMTGTITVTEGEAGEDVEIEIESFAFHPQNVTVTTGTTIIWTNLDSTGHTVTADEDAGSMEGNGSMEGGNGSMESDDGSMEGDDGAMEEDGAMMTDDEMTGDEGTADSPAPGLLGLVAVVAIAALIVARRQA